MASLQEIKNRLHSIKSTHKITKAMQMVASAKLRRAKKKWDSIQDYCISINETFNQLISSIKDLSYLTPTYAQHSTLFIVITSDIGLCGGYNTNVIKLTKKLLQTKDKLIVLGTKGVTTFKNNKHVIMFEELLGDQPDYLIAQEVTEHIISNYLLGKVNQVQLIYTKFINPITFKVENTLLVPLKKINDKLVNSQVEFEPHPKIVVRKALPLYLSSIIYNALVESKVSEMSSRRIAMENASDNADELIEKLNLDYNRVRQANITQEISEIIAGSKIE